MLPAPIQPGMEVDLMPKMEIVSDYVQDCKDAWPTSGYRAIAFQFFAEGWTEGDGIANFFVQTATENKEEHYVDTAFSASVRENAGEFTKIVVVKLSDLADYYRVRVEFTPGFNQRVNVRTTVNYLNEAPRFDPADEDCGCDETETIVENNNLDPESAPPRKRARIDPKQQQNRQLHRTKVSLLENETLSLELLNAPGVQEYEPYWKGAPSAANQPYGIDLESETIRIVARLASTDPSSEVRTTIRLSEFASLPEGSIFGSDTLRPIPITSSEIPIVLAKGSSPEIALRLSPSNFLGDRAIRVELLGAPEHNVVSLYPPSVRPEANAGQIQLLEGFRGNQVIDESTRDIAGPREPEPENPEQPVRGCRCVTSCVDLTAWAFSPWEIRAYAMYGTQSWFDGLKAVCTVYARGHRGAPGFTVRVKGKNQYPSPLFTVSPEKFKLNCPKHKVVEVTPTRQLFIELLREHDFSASSDGSSDDYVEETFSLVLGDKKICGTFRAKAYVPCNLSKLEKDSASHQKLQFENPTSTRSVTAIISSTDSHNRIDEFGYFDMATGFGVELRPRIDIEFIADFRRPDCCCVYIDSINIHFKVTAHIPSGLMPRTLFTDESHDMETLGDVVLLDSKAEEAISRFFGMSSGVDGTSEILGLNALATTLAGVVENNLDSVTERAIDYISQSIGFPQGQTPQKLPACFKPSSQKLCEKVKKAFQLIAGSTQLGSGGQSPSLESAASDAIKAHLEKTFERGENECLVPFELHDWEDEQNELGLDDSEEGSFPYLVVNSREGHYVREGPNASAGDDCCNKCAFIMVHGINNFHAEFVQKSMRGIAKRYFQQGGPCQIYAFSWDGLDLDFSNDLTDPGTTWATSRSEAASELGNLIHELRKNCPARKIFVAGHSMGNAVALRMMSDGTTIDGYSGMAAAVPDDVFEPGKEFANALKNTSSYYNFHSLQDDILAVAYELDSLFYQQANRPRQRFWYRYHKAKGFVRQVAAGYHSERGRNVAREEELKGAKALLSAGSSSDRESIRALGRWGAAMPPIGSARYQDIDVTDEMFTAAKATVPPDYASERDRLKGNERLQSRVDAQEKNYDKIFNFTKRSSRGPLVLRAMESMAYRSDRSIHSQYMCSDEKLMREAIIRTVILEEKNTMLGAWGAFGSRDLQSILQWGKRKIEHVPNIDDLIQSFVGEADDSRAEGIAKFLGQYLTFKIIDFAADPEDASIEHKVMLAMGVMFNRVFDENVEVSEDGTVSLRDLSYSFNESGFVPIHWRAAANRALMREFNFLVSDKSTRRSCASIWKNIAFQHDSLNF